MALVIVAVVIAVVVVVNDDHDVDNDDGSLMIINSSSNNTKKHKVSSVVVDQIPVERFFQKIRPLGIKGLHLRNVLAPNKSASGRPENSLPFKRI